MSERGLAVTLGNELHYLEGGDQYGRDEIFERTVLFLAKGFNIEALRLHGAEDLLDGPTQPVEADDAACIVDVFDPMGREQKPERRWLAFGRLDLAADDERHANRLGQATGSIVTLWPLDLDPAEF